MPVYLKSETAPLTLNPTLPLGDIGRKGDLGADTFISAVDKRLDHVLRVELPTRHEGSVRPNQSPRGKDREPRNWAEKMPDDKQEEMGFSKEVEWPDSDAEQQESKLVEVSEKTKKLQEEKCTRKVQNSVRIQTRRKYPLPKVVATKTPHLDSYLKTELSSMTKSEDKELAKIQTFILDALAPLTSILEADSEKVSYDEAIEATIDNRPTEKGLKTRNFLTISHSGARYDHVI